MQTKCVGLLRRAVLSAYFKGTLLFLGQIIPVQQITFTTGQDLDTAVEVGRPDDHPGRIPVGKSVHILDKHILSGQAVEYD